MSFKSATVTYSSTQEADDDLTFILESLPRYYTKSRIIRELLHERASQIRQQEEQDNKTAG